MLLLPEHSCMSGKQQQNREKSGALKLGKPGQCGLSCLEPEPPADFLLILPPIDQIMNQGTASDKELQLLELRSINTYQNKWKFVSFKFVLAMLWNML